MTQNTLDSNTIMPDGRPLFAWDNQIKMQEAELQQQKKAIKEFGRFKHLMGLIVTQEQNFSTLDWTIRIKMSDSVSHYDFWNHLEECCQIIKP